MLGEYGLTWPWESLHSSRRWPGTTTGSRAATPESSTVRASAMWCPARTDGNTSDAWPPKGSGLRELALRADGHPRGRGGPAGRAGVRFVGHGPGAEPRAHGRLRADADRALPWTSDPPDTDHLHLVGDGELILLAAATAADAFTACDRRPCEDVGSDDKAVDVTVGWLRAGRTRRRPVEQHDRRAQPVPPCRTFAPAPTIGEVVDYRIPLVANARRFTAGHRVRPVSGQRRPARGRASHHGLPARVRRDEQVTAIALRQDEQVPLERGPDIPGAPTHRPEPPAAHLSAGVATAAAVRDRSWQQALAVIAPVLDRVPQLYAPPNAVQAINAHTHRCRPAARRGCPDPLDCLSP